MHFFLNWQKCPCAHAHGLRLFFFFRAYTCLSFLSFFLFFFFFSLDSNVASFFSFFFSFDFLGIGHAFFKKKFKYTWFFSGHFFFIINLGDWFFFLFFLCGYLSHFCFDWTSFFNNGIWVNLFKLIFFIPPLFHSQPNKEEIN